MSSSSEVVVRVAFMQNGGNLAAAASAAAKEYKKIQDSLKLVNDPKYVQMLAMQETLAKKMGEVQIADAKQRLALLEKYGSVAAEQYAKEQDRARDRMRERVIRNQAEARWRTDPANRQAVFEESHAASQIARQNMEAQSRARREKEAYRGTPQGRQAIEEELRLRMQGRAEEADERRRQMREEMAYRKANPQAVDVERRARFEERHTQVEARTQDTREEVAFRKANPDVGQRETAENYQQGTIDAERQEQASGDQAAFMVDPANRDAVMNRMRTEAQERRNQGAVGLAQSQYRLEFDSTAEGDGYARDEIERKAKNRNVAMQAAAQASGRQADFAQSGKGQAAGLVQEKAARQDSMAKIRSEIALLQTRSKYVLDPKNRSALKEEIQLRQTLAAAMQRAKYTEQYGAAGGLMAAKDGAVAAGDAISGLFQKFALLTGAGVAAVATLDAPWATLTGSVQLFAGEVGIMLIPAVMDLCRWLQDGANWVKGWDDGTKDAISTTAKWGAGIVAASYAWSTLTPIISGTFGIVSLLGGGIISVTRSLWTMRTGQVAIAASSGVMNMSLLSTTAAAKASTAANVANAGALNTVAAAAGRATAAMWAFAMSNPVTALAVVAGTVASIAIAFSSVGSAAGSALGRVDENIQRLARLQEALDRLRQPGATAQEQQQAASDSLPDTLRRRLNTAASAAERQQILREAAAQAQTQLAQNQAALSGGAMGGLEGSLIDMAEGGTSEISFWGSTFNQARNRRNRLIAQLQGMGVNESQANAILPSVNNLTHNISAELREQILQAVRIQLQTNVVQNQATIAANASGVDTANLLNGGNANRPDRDLAMASPGFQSRQMDVFAMRDQIQMNLVRDDMEQRRFEQQMRALDAMNASLETIAQNTTPAGDDPAPQDPGGGWVMY